MRPITDVLRDYRGGKAVDIISRDYTDLVRAVDETGKPGELTIKIKVKPEKGGGSQKTLAISSTPKIPKQDIPEAVFFSDSAGNLHRSDPQQSEMFTDTARTGQASN